MRKQKVKWFAIKRDISLAIHNAVNFQIELTSNKPKRCVYLQLIMMDKSDKNLLWQCSPIGTNVMSENVYCTRKNPKPYISF